MVFNSIHFLIFFPVVCVGYFLVPEKLKNSWLLLSSYFFYMCWDIRYVFILIGITLITYYSGLVLEATDTPAYRRLNRGTLACCIVLCISILFIFKYANFALRTAITMLETVKIPHSLSVISIILPVGISFYVFQSVGYVIDVYKKNVAAEHNIINYALFVSFFPQLLSGPIGRAPKLLPQYRKKKSFDYNRSVDGLYMMLWGFFLKLVISDRVAVIVDNVISTYTNYSGVILAFAIALYAIQIYCDFCGYSVIAVGAAKIVGIELPDNFQAPYLSSSIREFWRRWHISLSTWLRDYIYFPLGGSRCEKWRHLLNILIVFLVSGLWHGASWTFIMWGLLHGLYQIAETVMHRDPPDGTQKGRVVLRVLRTILTFVLVDFAWLFFRAPDLKTAVKILVHAINGFNVSSLFDGSLLKLGMNLRNYAVLVAAMILMITVDILKYNGKDIRGWLRGRNTIIQDLIIILAVIVIAVFGIWGNQYNVSNFIYSQF